MFDDDEARQLLLRAAADCITRRGSAQVTMVEVADAAGVARSTVYRYFPTRDELLVALLLGRLDAALARIVASLPSPADARESLPELLLQPVAMVDGDPLNEALFSAESGGFVAQLELSSDTFLEVATRHIGPLLLRWQSDGQLRRELDVRDTVRWMSAVSTLLLMPPWRTQSTAARRATLDQYLLPALLRPRRRG